jgi:hypothetical protein
MLAKMRRGRPKQEDFIPRQKKYGQLPENFPKVLVLDRLPLDPVLEALPLSVDSLDLLETTRIKHELTRRGCHTKGLKVQLVRRLKWSMKRNTKPIRLEKWPLDAKPKTKPALDADAVDLFYSEEHRRTYGPRRLFGWGLNSCGELGCGDSNEHLEMKIVNQHGTENFIDCAGGKRHSIFLTEYGLLLTCGDGQYGQLGKGNNVPYQKFLGGVRFGAFFMAPVIKPAERRVDGGTFPSQTGPYRITFRPHCQWPVDGRLVIVWPPNFRFPEDEQRAFDYSASFSGKLLLTMKVEANMTTMIFDRADKIGKMGMQKPIEGGEYISFKVAGVQNPGVPGDFVFPLVQTQAFDGSVLDEASERMRRAGRHRSAHAASVKIVAKAKKADRKVEADKDIPEWQRRQTARNNEEEPEPEWWETEEAILSCEGESDDEEHFSTMQLRGPLPRDCLPPGLQLAQVAAGSFSSYARSSNRAEASFVCKGLEKVLAKVEAMLKKQPWTLDLQRVRAEIKQSLEGHVEKFNHGSCGGQLPGLHGQLWAWGQNQFGQLGVGDKANRSFPTRVRLLEQVSVKQLAAGQLHVLAVEESAQGGRLFAWGCGRNGRLGLGDVEHRVSPTVVESLRKRGLRVKVAAAGYSHSLAVVVHEATERREEERAQRDEKEVEREDNRERRRAERQGKHLDAKQQLWLWGHNGNKRLGLEAGEAKGEGLESDEDEVDEDDEEHEPDQLYPRRPGGLREALAGFAVGLGGKVLGGDGKGRPWMIKDVACGRAHNIMLVEKRLLVLTAGYTIERVVSQVWTWGCGRQGQLGSGDMVRICGYTSCSYLVLMSHYWISQVSEYLRFEDGVTGPVKASGQLEHFEIPVRIAAGKDVSFCITNVGKLYSWG